jgi:hypothetical protein
MMILIHPSKTNACPNSRKESRPGLYTKRNRAGTAHVGEHKRVCLRLFASKCGITLMLQRLCPIQVPCGLREDGNAVCAPPEANGTGSRSCLCSQSSCSRRTAGKIRPIRRETQQDLTQRNRRTVDDLSEIGGSTGDSSQKGSESMMPARGVVLSWMHTPAYGPGPSDRASVWPRCPGGHTRIDRRDQCRPGHIGATPSRRRTPLRRPPRGMRHRAQHASF